MLNSILDEIKDLQDAKKILEQIWLEMDPYRGGQISDDVRNKLRDYFKFDDSE